MKKVKLMSIALVCSMLCSCGNNADTSDSTAPADISGTKDTSALTEYMSVSYAPFEGDYPAYFEYKYESNNSARIALSDDGRLVVASTKRLGGVDFLEYSMDGDYKKIGKYDRLPETLAFMGDELFYTRIKWNNGVSEGIEIYRVNTEGGENELYADLDIQLEFGYGMSGNKDELYIIGRDAGRGELICEYPFFDDRGFSVFRIRGGEAERLPVDFPTAVCAKKSGGAIIAACDGGGYYVAQYENGELSEKVYEERDSRIDCIADVDGEHVLFSTYTKSDDEMLCASDVKNMYNAELLPQIRIDGERLYSAGGYCFFQTVNEDRKSTEFVVRRIKFSDYYKCNVPLKLICSFESDATPFGCGYTINMEFPSNEETALKILSQDKDYDMCYISTSDNISYAIKKKGSFYPLNNVAGVSDYLDKCFPEIKKAFTDDNGDIWALPLYADSQFVCSDYSNPDLSRMKLDEFVDFIDGLSDAEDSKSPYNVYTYTQVVLSDYVIKHDTFDTPEFRMAAEKLKNSRRLNRATITSSKSFSYDDVLTVGTNKTSYIIPALYDHDLKISGYPCITDANVVMPKVTFMCVNPYSEHLDDVLDYIERVTEYQLTAPDKFILTPENGVYTESGNVRQMLRLCRDAKVYFTYPPELYWDDFYKYCAGGITLDSFVKEADRKLKTYLNE